MSVDPDSVVLVVDDEPEVAEMYYEYLDEEHVVRVATSGEEAMGELDTGVDVVLLDRRMPGMSGDEVLQRIRDQGFECRVVMVTAIPPEVDILDLEFDEYLIKPVEKAQIQNVVERMLAREALKQRILETFALASKLATLEGKLDIEQLERSAEYKRLLDRFTELRNEFDLPNSDAYYSDSTIEKFQAMINPKSED